MASLEKRGRTFRVVFRYQGEKYTRALSTRSEIAAKAALARLEDNLHRLELGTLSLPTGGDLISYLVGDGATKPAREAPHSEVTAQVAPQQFLEDCGMTRRNQAKPNACRRSWPLGNLGAVTALPSVPALVR